MSEKVQEHEKDELEPSKTDGVRLYRKWKF